MTRADLQFRVDTCNHDSIRAHLLECDDQFEPPLSQRLDIRDYSHKIRANAMTFEAWQGETLVGLAAAYMNRATRSGYITSVSVLPQFGRENIATVLITQLMNHARDAGIHEVALEVGKTNAAAIALYRKFGFRAVEDRDNMVLMAVREIDPNDAVESE